jgi:hypothetical protein
LKNDKRINLGIVVGIFRLNHPAQRAGLPGKEIIYFALRPLAPPKRQGLRVELPVKGHGVKDSSEMP